MVKIKDKDEIAVPVGANNHSPVQTPAVPIDEYHGMGGSYILDPAIGKRVRVVAVGEPLRDNEGAINQEEKAHESE
ncbi:MAG: hypothetical protein KGN35_07590 [Betaproteobacteria bacterium]|nr:hypothetical protein [Betaproteobacteria bacterium]